MKINVISMKEMAQGIWYNGVKDDEVSFTIRDTEYRYKPDDAHKDIQEWDKEIQSQVGDYGKTGTALNFVKNTSSSYRKVESKSVKETREHYNIGYYLGLDDSDTDTHKSEEELKQIHPEYNDSEFSNFVDGYEQGYEDGEKIYDNMFASEKRECTTTADMSLELVDTTEYDKSHDDDRINDKPKYNRNGEVI